ncbi:FYVE-domain-containing protein [Metschnikowia bicuspidata var. bicuspidata NRRL YB-4993]|uniref:RING-type E3 ubiquitin transferase n=1 Tax=Metschnikowia bicuspidata var. bicuspidata NRRL YB-4993 TaxID=869754 RepID=A0A1A0HJ75_9ASCO|nr:FYVE-domain-containing protein [Metschnikowia bicuspidata var. bicuspidata NRRL YB-4993]OBA24051.1 FYVE-domain-containing protein [Metschnikowia bicuspidata var. bicuspidata NRRL YB-4993]
MPVWKADATASKCYLCKARFTLFNRRHHCRKCGQLVCATCSSKQVRYFANSYVLNSQNTPEKARSHVYYRTCDVCVDEIHMMRSALSPVPATETASVLQGHRDEPPAAVGPSADVHMIPGATSAANPLKTAPNRAQHASSDPPEFTGSNEPHDADSDADLCPVCGVDLGKQFLEESLGGPLASSAAYETYKEAHVSRCLVTYDFASNHLRLSSPPDGLHARNRMLVYNMPPIPEPSYETISDGSPNAGAVAAKTDGEIPGLVRSTATFSGTEKDDMDAECVICLEDLCPGDKVGRLECLCVFHYKCIKDWFNKKSYAECPVHYLHS